MAKKQPTPAPAQGDEYECGICGMTLEVTYDCGCADGDHVTLRCCGRELTKAANSAEPAKPGDYDE